MEKYEGAHHKLGRKEREGDGFFPAEYPRKTCSANLSTSSQVRL